jgi:predicted nucleic acid binding AN1-type Zn finger protein
MDAADVDNIGAHCQMPYCGLLDFLPFRCESCHGKFCLDHRSETAHNCAKAGAWARARAGHTAASSTTSSAASSKPSILNHEKQCADPACKTLIETALTPGVHCDTCNRKYCLKHRMREDHNCANLIPLGARTSSASKTWDKGMTALGKLKAWSRTKLDSPQSTSGASSTATASKKRGRPSPVASLNALKATAKGDASVPPAQRVYVFVEASADTTKAKFPTGRFFYARAWSVGRVLDAAAKALQVENVNNRVQGEAERLRVFHVEGGRLLEFSEKVGDAVQNANTLVLLRGVGHPPEEEA